MNAMAVALVEQHLLLRANFSVEEVRTEDGSSAYSLHFDIPKGNVGERYTVSFDKDGFDKFLAMCQGAKSGIQVESVLPKEVGRIH